MSDSLIIAKQADAVIFIVKSNDTRVGVAQNGIGKLVRVNAKIAGVVLNQVDTKKMSDSGYQGYYNDYSYGEESSS